MSRIVIQAPCTIGTGPGARTYNKGDVVEVSAAELTAIGTAGGTTRAVSTSNMREILGEAGGFCSNASR